MTSSGTSTSGATRNRILWTPIGLAIGVLIGAVAAGGIALASPSNPDRTDVSITPMPTKQIAYKKSVAANKHLVLDAIGGNTTIPSNATTVELQVTVIPSGTGSGSVLVSPAANEALGVDVAWDGGQTTQTIRVGIGLRDQVTVKNTSAATVKVSVSLKGYSTQVTADGINGSGGDVGTALLNDGNGHAYWGDPGSGGGGTPTPPSSYAATQETSGLGAIGGEGGDLPNSLVTITLPTGRYFLVSTFNARGNTAVPSAFRCNFGNDFSGGSGGFRQEVRADDTRAFTINDELHVTAAREVIKLNCKLDDPTQKVFFDEISVIATRVATIPTN